MANSKARKYSSDELKKMTDESDWQRAAAKSDAEIEAAIASDPDETGLDDWIEKAMMTRPNQKQRVYAAYDAYVIDYFRQEGRGYQQRMNAVLKAYVDAQLAKQAK